MKLVSNEALELGQTIKEELYANSVPLSSQHPSRLVQNVTAICQEKNFDFVPELRSVKEDLPSAAGALAEKNAIIFQELLLASFQRICIRSCCA